MGSPDHGHHHAQHHAHDQGHGRDEQRGAHAVEILHPPVVLKKGLIEFDKELLPERSDPRRRPSGVSTARTIASQISYMPLHLTHNIPSQRTVGMIRDDKEKGGRGRPLAEMRIAYSAVM